MNKSKKVQDQDNIPDRASTRLSLRVWLALVFLFLTGAGIRLYDLTDPPLDYHPTRQLRGAILARSIYYTQVVESDLGTRELAVSIAKVVGSYEPPILETIVAYTYLLTDGEAIWVARLYNTFFWLVGSAFLFLLARRISGVGGALLSLGYALILPFAVQASRSFQPDPAMTMWIVLGAYSLHRWQTSRVWRWAVLAGLSCGLSILTKPVAIYMVAPCAVWVVLYAVSLRRAWRDPQVWCMAGIMALPAVFYYLPNRQGGIGDYFSSWTLSLAHLLADPSFYIRWLSFLQDLVGLAPVFLGLAGVLIASRQDKPLLAGLWVGYFVYGISLPYQMYTHSYYSIQLIPLIALSLAPIGALLAKQISSQPKLWRFAFLLLMLIAVAYPAWVSIANAKAENHRTAPEYWQKIGSFLPVQGRIIALTQDYGFPLMYYGMRKISLWRTSGEQELADLRGREKEFESSFVNRIEDMDYFLVTAFNQFDRQPDLKETLYGRYPVMQEGKGYIIFDLAHPLSP